jgi:4-hydroxybenzoate polyprenyltransferase
MKGPLIVAAILLGAVLLQAYWPGLNDLIDRWRDWRHERAFSKRHTEKGR